jgi:LysM repeat protein
MSSIRPLITITVLVVVGVVLYVKINEGTPRPAPSTSEEWTDSVEGVPPLAASSVAPTTSDGAAPAWPATPVAAASSVPPADVPPVNVAATNVADPAATVAGATPPTPVGPATEISPAVPPVPPLPEIAPTTQAEATTPVAPPLPTALPANVPEARYPDQAGATSPGAAATATAVVPTTDVPPLATAPVAGTSSEAAPSSAQGTAVTPEQVNAAAAVSSGIPSTPAPLDANPLRSSAATAENDRYGSNAATTEPLAAPAPTTPVEQSFVDSWPAIQALLDRGELTEAHKQLSKWYGDPSLTPTDAERVDTLLSQLAGTVVYSTEHRLAPAHVVKQGETLETIAKEYNVPWQLLAKINGVSAIDQVRPGQELKVVRGPFSAVVDLSRNQLTLLVDNRYAGKFPVMVAPGQTVNDGEWIVGRKSNEQAPGRALLLQGNPTTPGSPAPMLVIASDSLPTSAADGTVIKIAAKDAEELTDILSIGSRVVTRR